MVVGTINNNEARKISLDLHFMPAGEYKLERYSDAADSDEKADHLNKSVKTIKNFAWSEIQLAPGGGNVIIITKSKK